MTRLRCECRDPVRIPRQATKLTDVELISGMAACVVLGGGWLAFAEKTRCKCGHMKTHVLQVRERESGKVTTHLLCGPCARELYEAVDADAREAD